MKILKEHGSTALIILLAVFFAWLLAGGGTHPLTGQAAPDFKLPLLDGAEVDLASHRGKEVVVLDFWASWCPPCRKSLPALDAVSRAYAGKPVKVYAVNIRESPALVSEFARRNGLTLPILLDDTGLVADDYGVTTIPQTVIVDRSGRVHRVHVGVPYWGFEEALAADIDAALAAAGG